MHVNKHAFMSFYVAVVTTTHTGFTKWKTGPTPCVRCPPNMDTARVGGQLGTTRTATSGQELPAFLAATDQARPPVLHFVQ